MASFLEDIRYYSGRKQGFEEGYREDFLHTLCNPTVSINKWESAITTFLCLEANVTDPSFVFDFDYLILNRIVNMEHLLKAIGCLRKLERVDRWDNYGCILSDLMEASNAVAELSRIIDELAYLAVTDIHHKVRKLRNMACSVEKDAKQTEIGELIHTVDQIDQALLSVSESHGDTFDASSIQTLLHDSIYNAASCCSILPSRLHMEEVESLKADRVNGGGFADIYNGTLSDGRVVALKVPRCFGKPEEIKKVYAEISKEAFVWHFSKHKNILPLLGIGYKKFQDGKPDMLILATPWMANGTLRHFLRDQPSADRKNIIKGVAFGLLYLHTWRTPPVVHGDLRCDNILVDEDGTPKIADFGLSRVKDVQASLTGSSSAGARGSLRWQAPELLSPETFDGSGKQTFATDIYAFGMTCLEIITEQVPYFGFNDVQVITVVWHGKQPSVEEDAVYKKGLSKGEWEMIKDCWKTDAQERPSAAALWRMLRYGF